MKFSEWLTPRRTVSLVLVLAGSSAQIFATVSATHNYLRGVGLALLVAGVVIELVGQIMGDGER